MFKLLLLLAACVLLAYYSQQYTQGCVRMGYPYRKREDLAYVLLVVILILFAGLRTDYNDTRNYMNGFVNAPVLSVFLSDPENLNPFKNPLFYLLESSLKSITDNPQMLIFLSAAFSQICYVRFFKRYSHSFVLSIYIYFTLGTFIFTLAAIKQVMAMAVMTLAFPCIEKKQWGRYYLLVLAAMLIHTYALAFAVLPFFRTKPWRVITVSFILLMVAVMFNFEEAITAFMEQANDLGKSLAEYEVFDDATINIFRIAVYAVPPLISLVFQRWVLRDNREIDNVLIHMSIISLAFMMLGTQSGANMFGRMGNYFELGTICCLPGMLEKTFSPKSYRLVIFVACVCFMGFFLYANAVKLDFGAYYRATGIWNLFLP